LNLVALQNGERTRGPDGRESAAFTVLKTAFDQSMYALSIRKTTYLGEERQDRVFGSKGNQNVPKCQKDAQADANAHGVLPSY
jgi:hypothetical protein